MATNTEGKGGGRGGEKIAVQLLLFFVWSMGVIGWVRCGLPLGAKGGTNWTYVYVYNGSRCLEVGEGDSNNEEGEGIGYG